MVVTGTPPAFAAMVAAGGGILVNANGIQSTISGVYVLTDRYGNILAGYGLPDRPDPSTYKLAAGYQSFDTALKKPIWWDGSANWVDSMGAVV